MRRTTNELQLEHFFVQNNVRPCLVSFMQFTLKVGLSNKTKNNLVSIYLPKSILVVFLSEFLYIKRSIMASIYVLFMIILICGTCIKRSTCVKY